MTFDLPAGQSYGSGSSAGVAGGLCHHPGLCGVSGWEPSCSTAPHGVCSDGESLLHFCTCVLLESHIYVPSCDLMADNSKL